MKTSPFIYIFSPQPSLLALALLCFEAQEEHDPEHMNQISEALKNLQHLLNVSSTGNDKSSVAQ